MLHYREGFIPLTVGACGPSPSDACFRGVPAATRRAWSGLLQPSSIECNFMSQLPTSSSPPVAPHAASRRRSYLRLSRPGLAPSEDFHLTDSVRSQAHWRAASLPPGKTVDLSAPCESSHALRPARGSLRRAGKPGSTAGKDARRYNGYWHLRARCGIALNMKAIPIREA